jgi:hypothetical protein
VHCAPFTPSTTSAPNRGCVDSLARRRARSASPSRRCRRLTTPQRCFKRSTYDALLAFAAALSSASRAQACVSPLAKLELFGDVQASIAAALGARAAALATDDMLPLALLVTARAGARLLSTIVLVSLIILLLRAAISKVHAGLRLALWRARDNAAAPQLSAHDTARRCSLLAGCFVFLHFNSFQKSL